MRALFLILLFSLSTAGLLRKSYAQEAFPLRDSLLAKLETLGHDTLRLKTLYQLTRINNADTTECSGFINELLQEAALQNNSYYTVKAYIRKMILAYNSYNIEATRAIYEQLAPIARREKLYVDLFFARRCVIDMQLLAQDFERSGKEAQQMLEEAIALDCKSGILDAYQSLANFHRMTYNTKKAIEILEKALAMAILLNVDNAIENIYQSLNYLYEIQYDYRNWLRILKSWEDRIRKTSDFDNDPTSLIIYASYLKYYAQQGNWEQAERYRALGDKFYAQINAPLYKIRYAFGCVDYFQRRGEHELALEKMREAVAMIKILSSSSDYYSNRLVEAEMLKRMGRSEEALPIFKEVIQFKDSLQIATINKQYEQLKKDFNADQLLFEQAQLRHRMQLFTLGLLAVGLLIVGAFVVQLLRSRRILLKAEREMREITEQMELANQAKDRFLSNINTSIRVPLNDVVEGSLRLAEQQVSDAAERQVLSADIRRKSTDLLRMINDILDLSRLEAGMMKFEVTDVEITSTLLDAIGASPAIQQGLEIEPAFAMDTLYMTRMDGNRLLQVFRSLFEDKAQECTRITVTTSEISALLLEIVISGSRLAQSAQSQEIIIRNEINRMLVLHFGGTYEIADSNEVPEIRMTLPVGEIIRPEGEATTSTH